MANKTGSLIAESMTGGTGNSSRWGDGNSKPQGNYSHEESLPADIKERDYKLDITWLKDESLEDTDELPEPQDLASEAITELEAIVDDLREIVALIEKEDAVEK